MPRTAKDLVLHKYVIVETATLQQITSQLADHESVGTTMHTAASYTRQLNVQLNAT